MPEPLTMAVAQPPCVAHDVAANAAAHAQAVRGAGARVIVFPELSLTGYELDAAPVAVDDARLTPLVEACAQTGSIALAGAPVRVDGGRPSIAMLAVDGIATSVVYRKVWLGGEEPQHFSAGPSPAVLDVDGWRLGLAICRDTGIAEHAAGTAALGIDVYVAAVLHSADEVGVQEQRARLVASTYGVWVAMASFAGSTGGGYDRAAGRSTIWRGDGVAVAASGPEPGEVARATLG